MRLPRNLITLGLGLTLLNAGLATRLRDGAVKTDNVTEAKRLADEYREDAQRNRALASNGVTTPTPTTSSATAAAAQ